MPAKSARKKKNKPSSGRSWKDLQSETRTRKKVKLAIGVLTLIVALLLISWGVRFTQSLFNPWRLPASYHKNYLWDEQFNINLLIRSKNIALLSYNPKEAKLVIIDIPDEVFVEVAHGFGPWQLGSVYGLGQSQKGLGGDKLLVDTLTSFFALPIDGFLDFDKVDQKSASEIANVFRQSPFSILTFLSSFKSNLTVWELLKVNLKINSVRFDKVKEMDLAQLSILNKGNLTDKTPILTSDPVRLDSILTDLIDPIISSERKSIAVLNATNHPQLAFKASRLITNLGGNVIMTINAKDTLKQTRVIGQDSQTLKRLKQIFELDGKISPEDNNLISERAQITVLLGEDYFNQL